MIKYFVPSDFNISGQPIPDHVNDAILKWHINPLEKVRIDLGFAIWPSQKSAWRPRVWEYARDRNGESQHCFGEKRDGTYDEKAKGATDITCRNFEQNKFRLLDSLIENTNYTRLAIYDTFIHGDYKATSGKRYIFQSDENSKWELIRIL